MYEGEVTLTNPLEQVGVIQEFNILQLLLKLQDGMAVATAIVKKLAPNSAFIPSSNHPDIIAGQGTIAMELLEQVHAG